MLRLFLFHDAIEEILVAANDHEDCFDLIEEVFGADSADSLILSGLNEYNSTLAAAVTKNAHRGVLRLGEPGTFTKRGFIDVA